MEATVNPHAPIEGKDLTVIMNEKQKEKKTKTKEDIRVLETVIILCVCGGGGEWRMSEVSVAQTTQLT